MALGPKQGVYIISAARIFAGWGSVSEARWPYPKKGVAWPLAEPPGLDKIARFNKLYAYSRVRNLDDARRCIYNRTFFLVSVSTHGGWAKAPQGVISMPETGQPFGENHCVTIVGYNDETRSLNFANCWGASWGDRGFGVLPYDYFTRFTQDAWYFQPPLLGCPIKKVTTKRFMCISTLRHNALGYPCLVHDVWEARGNIRVGWCIATERDEHLDVEEFFVRPEYRGQRIGSQLMCRLLGDCNGAELPLRFWIPYVDCNSPSRNILAMNHLLTKNGFVARVSGVNWAQYVAEKRVSAEPSSGDVKLEPSDAAPAPPAAMIDLDTVVGEIEPNKDE